MFMIKYIVISLVLSGCSLITGDLDDCQEMETVLRKQLDICRIDKETIKRQCSQN